MIRNNSNQQMLNERLLDKNQVNLLQADNVNKDYSSVQNLVKLPSLRKLQPSQKIFAQIQPTLKSSAILSNQLKDSIMSLYDNLGKQFSTFTNPKQFCFRLPDSKFPSIPQGQLNQISYQQKNIVQDQDTFKQRLSPQQIQQISFNGQFQVKSNQEYITLPYVWKINDFLFKGKKNIENIWFNTVAYAHIFIYKNYEQVKENIPTELKSIVKLPKRLFSLIFGKKSQIVSYTVDYHQQVAKDFWNQVIDKYYQHNNKQFGSQLFEYLNANYTAQDHIYIVADENNLQEYNQKVKKQKSSRDKYQEKLKKINQKKQKIINISNQFNNYWQKNKKKIFNQISEQYNNNVNNISNNSINLTINNKSRQQQQLLKKQTDQQILQKFNDQKFTLYTNYLQKKLPQANVPLNVIEAIVTLLALLQIMNKKDRKNQNIKQREKERVMKKIKEEFKIKSLNYLWYNKKVQEEYQPIQKQIQRQYQLNYLNNSKEFTIKLSAKQIKIFQLFLQYKKTYISRIQSKKEQKPQVLKASRTFFSTYHLLPPYKVIKTNQNTSYSYYIMIKQQQMKITTDTHFWKLKLYCMRVKCWTINCVVFLIYFCYKGPFGLRCLIGIDDFNYDQYINSTTGEVINEKRKTVIGSFIQVMTGITKSRQNFEALPDRGLFGKNFSRLINYIQCYIFRFFIVGLIITLILYPIAILFSSIITGVLIFTIWAWMPVVLLVTYLFNILIYQFQSSQQPYGFFIRSFPLISLVIILLFSIIKILFYLIMLIIISPIVCIFIILFAIVYRIWRTFTDCIMLFLIRTLGRTPSNNTAIAKKISGPGMSKQFYMSINQEDVYVLVQSELEQILMGQYNRIVNKQINKPVEIFNQVIQMLIKPLNINNSSGYNYNNNGNTCNPIHKSVNSLRKNYQKTYTNYMSRYPRRPYNVRFTQQQLDNYFQNTISIVKNFVQKNNLSQWIFQQYNLIKDDYEQLTRKIWQDIYQCGEEIFEPLEKIDTRFKLQDQYKNSSSNQIMKKNVDSVMQALKGQLQLKPRKANIASYHHGLLNSEYQLDHINQLFYQIEYNSSSNCSLNLDLLKTILCPHLRIKQLIKKHSHEYHYQMNKKNK